MLTELTISNFALIDQLEVNFSHGMTSITGETGAGKSILLGGLALALGKRADLSTLKDKSRKCFIDATFSISAYGLQDFFHSFDLDYGAITTVRREIVPSGKSRAFINDTPVTLDVLQQLGERLIDVHSQNQTLSLVQEDYQLDVLDALAKNTAPLEEYASVLQAYKTVTQKIESLSAQKTALEEERDYNRFLLEELNAAPLTENSMEAMESEIQALSSVEELEENLTKALQIIEEEQMGIAVQLNEVRASLQKVAGISERYEQLSSRVESLRIELTDVSSELSNAQEMVEANPARLEQLNGQLQLLNDLLNKHHVQTIEELVERRNQLEEKVIQTENLEEDLQTLGKEQKELIDQLEALCLQLGENRQKAIPVFTEQMEKILALLGMPNARFKLALIPTDSYLRHGKERLDFAFSANKGSDFGPLKK